MGTSNECRKYSVTSDAISNSCWHDTVTGSDFDLIAHGQVRIMPQGWEKLLRQCKGFVSKEVTWWLCVLFLVTLHGVKLIGTREVS